MMPSLQTFSNIPRPDGGQNAGKNAGSSDAANRENLEALPAGEIMTGAQAIVRALEESGVTDVFGIPGGAILPVYDAIKDDTKFRFVLACHGQNRRMHCNLRSGSHKPCHSNSRRKFGFCPHGRNHRSGRRQRNRNRRIPRSGHDRNHMLDFEAFLPCHRPARHPQSNQGSIYDCKHRASRSCCRRRFQNRADEHDALLVSGFSFAARIFARQE